MRLRSKSPIDAGCRTRTHDGFLSIANARVGFTSLFLRGRYHRKRLRTTLFETVQFRFYLEMESLWRGGLVSMRMLLALL